MAPPIEAYQTEEERMRQEQAAAESSAMDRLYQSMQKQADVSPQQSYAAALLAAIPTLGGYLIDRSVKAPKVPEGVYFEDPNTYFNHFGQQGAIKGAEIGGKAAGQYFTNLDAQQEQENKINQAIAGQEFGKANKLASGIEALTQSDLQRQAVSADQEDRQQFEKEMLPLRTQAQIQVAQARPVTPPRDPYEGYTPEQKANEIARKSGLDAQGNPIRKPFSIDASTQERLQKITSFTEEVEGNIIPLLQKMPTYAGFKAAQAFSQADREGLMAQFENAKDVLVRARTGAAMNKEEGETYDKMLLGNFDADPQLIARVLGKLTASMRRMSATEVRVAEAASDPEKLMALVGPQGATSAPIKEVRTDPSGKQWEVTLDANGKMISKRAL